jgi:hypothetical protein
MMDDKIDEKKGEGVLPVTPDKALVAGLTHEFDYPGKSGTFEIYSIGGEPLVTTSGYKLLIAKFPTGQPGLVMIAAKSNENWLVEKQAHFLATLQDMAAFAASGAKIQPNYGAFMPVMVEAMQTDEESARAGVFMGYGPETKSYKELVPLSVALKDQRVDLQTALWMLGKYLKVLDFVHVMGFAVNFVDETNFLVETVKHGVFTLNWMYTLEGSDANPESQKADIVNLAGIVWRASGGTEKSDPPYDEAIMSKAGYDEFVAFLKRLLAGDTKPAGDEMTALYEMADRIWTRVDDPGGYNPDGKKRPFHDWVTYPVAK